MKNTKIRDVTKAKDVITQILSQKWKWAGHIQRNTDERWSQAVTNWTIIDHKRRRGRPLKRWSDDITKNAGTLWSRKARDREKWRLLEEAFTAEGGPYKETT